MNETTTKLLYCVELFVLISVFLAMGMALTTYIIFNNWSWGVYSCLEFGAIVLSGLYVVINWNNPMGFADLW